MIDEACNLVLQNILRRERRSLLLYSSEAYPWTTFADQQSLDQLQKMIEEETQAIARLSNFLRRRGVTMPYFEPYPMSYTTYNFVTLEFLVDKLLAEERKSATALERDLASVSDPDGKKL